MESLGVIQHSSSLPGKRFDVVADLRLTQNQLLRNHGRDVLLNKSVLNMEIIFPELLICMHCSKIMQEEMVSTYNKCTAYE